MKRNEFKSNLFKSITGMLFVLVVTSVTFAQTRLPQNIRRVTVTSQYVVEKGNYKSESYAINQEVFDSLGRCHTEIDFGFMDHYPHNYRWHSFNGKLKVKTETFINEKLSLIEEFTYNSDSLLTKKTIKNVTPGDTSVYFILNYKYDIKKNPIEITVKTALGKTAYVSKSTFNSFGKELTRNVKAKKNFLPKDSIIRLTVTPFYDSLNRLRSEQITITKTDKAIITKTIKYSYDKQNHLTGILELDEKGNQKIREEREYQNSKGRLTIIRYYNNNNILAKMIGKRYELYKFKDRRSYEIEY